MYIYRYDVVGNCRDKHNIKVKVNTRSRDGSKSKVILKSEGYTVVDFDFGLGVECWESGGLSLI